MHRRRVLAVTASGLLSLAGCLDSNEPVAEPTTGRSTTGHSTTDDPPDHPTYIGADIEVLNVGCKSGDETTATATVENGAVIVRGTILGDNGCYVPSLDMIVHDVESGELEVVVKSVEEKDGDTACIQCITAIDYAVTARFRGGYPERVVVSHRRGADVSEVADVSLSGTAE